MNVLSLLYNTILGRVLLSVLIKPPVSKLVGVFMDSYISCLFICGFIRRNHIKTDKRVKYKSFNDFFTRKEARAFAAKEDEAAAPCDGWLTAYTITDDSVFCIKNSLYSVSGILQSKRLAAEFRDGTCLIFRLTPSNYHRYCYIDDGEVVFSKKIEGVLHTVRPIAVQRYKVYAQNSREYVLLQTKNFGKVVQMEVGALFIGRIVNHAVKKNIKRGEEKGMFEFGGSTIVVLFRKGAVTIDERIWENTRQGKETVVRLGERIGEKGLRCKLKV
uniref:Phosphatidylserine decarboxylase n=1 Tax=uncultured bacterium contig00017 TaxID=1181508 RepID=A0A806JY14_9BACT|nr:phosphatidylserine decarboxylase [uncultured bacterium contig00017]